jgi:methionyl-tRNA formyltransferase
MLKVVILGYGELTQSIVLGILESGHKLEAVFRWEKRRPNKFYAFLRDTFFPDPLLSIMRTHNIRDINAKYTNSERFRQEIQKLAPDVIIVGSWGEILKQETIDLPKVACINCHPSLLPAHRGSNPYVSAIMAGEKTTGVTFHLMMPKIDAGDILLQEQVEIADNDNAGSLKKKCSFTAKQMVPALLNKLERAELVPEKQD